MFSLLKINRSIATRYDQLAASFLSMVHIASATRAQIRPRRLVSRQHRAIALDDAYGARVFVSGGDPRRGESQNPVISSLEHDDAGFLRRCMNEGISRYGAPEIVNTDQGSQFTSKAWTDVLNGAGVRISMDGKGRWIDNVFMERLWRSVKYEEVYLHAYCDGREARQRLTVYFDFYNRQRGHQSHDYRTPDEVYFGVRAAEISAAA